MSIRDTRRRIEQHEMKAGSVQPALRFSAGWIDAADGLLETMGEDDAQAVLAGMSLDELDAHTRAFYAAVENRLKG